MRKLVKAACVLTLFGSLSLGTPSASRADFQFDPDGSGSLGRVFANTFDYSVDNAIAVGGMTAIRNFVLSGGTVQTPFNTLFQARLIAITDSDANVQPLGNINGTGAGAYEITIVARVTEIVTAATLSTGNAQFKVTPAAGDFLEIYYDSTPDANALAGTGYNDGRLIYKATSVATAPGNSESNFSTGAPETPPNLDRVGTNNYPGINSVSGTGGSTIQFATTYLDPAFFISILNPTASSELTGELKLPFKQVNPAALFVSTMNAMIGGPPFGSGPPPTQPGATVASVGTTNGAFVGTAPNIMFQTDASQTFQLESVPEPSTMLLSMVGLGGLGVARLVRRRRLA